MTRLEKEIRRIVSYMLGSQGSGIQTVVAGDGLTVDNTDPQNPSISTDFSLDPTSPESITKIWAGSQAQYDGLTPDANTIYFIV